VQARNEDAIRRKILEKVATLTTHPAFHQDESETEDEEDDLNDNIDPDLVVTTASDASGDSKVNANSIDGEDDVVDVTMNGVNVRRSIEQSDSEPSKSGSVRDQELYVYPSIPATP
jgi:ubiquitin carboxyl-terminal hydrolase 4/11